MTKRDANRFRLAVDAVTAAFTLVARHTMSSDTLELIGMNRRLGAMGVECDAGLLGRTLHSLNALAQSPQLFGFRLVTVALAQSLPRTCSAHATSMDVRTAAFDLRQLANEAESLRAPDVAVKLAAIIDAMLEQDSVTQQRSVKGDLH